MSEDLRARYAELEAAARVLTSWSVHSAGDGPLPATVADLAEDLERVKSTLKALDAARKSGASGE
jgi:hypothetical protein